MPELSYNRRSCDHPDHHPSPCSHLAEHSSIQEELLADVAEIKQTCKEMKEMLEAYQSIKGFVKTVAIIGTLAKWITVTGAAIAAIYYWFKPH